MNSVLNEKLIAASASGDVESIRASIKEGADVNAPDTSSPYKFTPLILAVRAGFTDATKELINSRAHINLPDSKGITPLIAASWFGKIDAVRVLIDAGAKLDDVSIDGNTALMEASVVGHKEAVSLLIKAGADISMINKTGHSAFDMSKTKEIKMLINNKMNFFNHLRFMLARFMRKG